MSPIDFNHIACRSGAVVKTLDDFGYRGESAVVHALPMKSYTGWAHLAVFAGCAMKYCIVLLLCSDLQFFLPIEGSVLRKCLSLPFGLFLLLCLSSGACCASSNPTKFSPDMLELITVGSWRGLASCGCGPGKTHNHLEQMPPF